jgi:hypothetical protein
VAIEIPKNLFVVALAAAGFTVYRSIRAWWPVIVNGTSSRAGI